MSVSVDCIVKYIYNNNEVLHSNATYQHFSLKSRIFLYLFNFPWFGEILKITDTTFIALRKYTEFYLFYTSFYFILILQKLVNINNTSLHHLISVEKYLIISQCYYSMYLFSCYPKDMHLKEMIIIHKLLQSL